MVTSDSGGIIANMASKTMDSISIQAFSIVIDRLTSTMLLSRVGMSHYHTFIR